MCQVPGVEGGGCPASSLRRGEDASEKLREHALARAVRPDYTEALAARDCKVDTDQDWVIVEGHARLLEFDDLLATPRSAAEFEPYLAPLQHGTFDLVHAVDLTLFVTDLFDVTLIYHQAGPEFEAPNRLFEPRYLLLLCDVELLLSFELEFARDRIRRVIARPRGDPAVFQLGDLLHRLVEQVAVGTPREARGEHRQLALPTAQLSHGTFDIPSTETERPDVATRLTLESWPAELRKTAQEPLLTLQYPLHPAQVARHHRRAELLLAISKLFLELRDLGPGGAHDLHQRAFVTLDVLGQRGNAQTAAPDHGPPVDPLRASEDPEHGGLARAIGADEPDPRPGDDLHVQTREHGPAPVELLYGTQSYEGHAALLRSTRRIRLTRLIMMPLHRRRITHLDDL